MEMRRKDRELSIEEERITKKWRIWGTFNV